MYSHNKNIKPSESDTSFEIYEKKLALTAAYSQKCLDDSEKYLKMAIEEVAQQQEAEKVKSGCFFWRKNKIAAAPQSATERTSILSPVK